MDKPLVKGSEEVYRISSDEIDITKRTKLEMVAAESEQTSSSSYGDSDSEVENADTVTKSEAVSGFRESALDSDCREAFNMRKKKTTTHWRSFIQPLMWRIKWVELQMKNLQSQAETYDRKIEKYRKQKQVQVENTTLEGIGIKSIPFSWKVARSAILKRKKRKRTETTKDLAAYLSHHSLFSYYETLKSVTGCVHDKFQNPAKPFHKVNIDDKLLVSDEPLSLQPGNNDNSMECLLQKIETLQSRVGTLKGRADILISENAGMFPDMENSFLHMVYNDIRSSLECNASSQLMCEYTSALPVPESAVLGHTEEFPDLIGSRDLASYDSMNNGEAEFLTNNQTMKVEEKNFEEVIIQQAQNTRVNSSCS